MANVTAPAPQAPVIAPAATPQAQANPAATTTPAPNGSFFSNVWKDYALPIGTALVHKVTANPVQAVLATAVVGLLWDKYRQSKSPNDIDPSKDVEMDDFNSELFQRIKREKIKTSIAQMPLAMHRTEEMETVDWKLRIRNVVLLLHFLVGASAMAGIIALSCSLPTFGWLADLGKPLLWTIALASWFNVYLLCGIGSHLKMDRYTMHVPRTEHNKSFNLNKAKYRSNVNNTLRFLAAALPIPGVTPLVSFCIKMKKWNKEGQKLLREYNGY